MSFAPLLRLAGVSGGGATTSGAVSGLPRDLLAAASRRLGILALVTIALSLINLAAMVIVAPRMGNIHLDWRTIILFTVIAIVLSLGIYVYTRRTHDSPWRVINVGLGYQVALCALSALLSHAITATLGSADFSPRLSWSSALLIFFPALVPATPARTAVAALIGASMDSLAMGASIALGNIEAPMSIAFWMHFPNYLCAGLGILVSHVITGLGRQVRDARELGNYRLGTLLGRGGMGEVYRAEHRMLVRPAAIKLIRPEALAWGDAAEAEMAVARFKREAQAAASLRSPHTIELYDFGVADNGTLYFVMELLDGIDLDTFVTKFGPMSAGRAVRVLRQACESLAEAHARDLVHRDVKPANILLCRLGLRHDFTKVLDFGLVKARRSDQLGAGMQTAANVVAGTPAFMSPEAALGQTVDGRTDVYGLGCVGYWLLTGHLVFDAPTAFQILARHIEDEPVPPSRRAETSVPAALDDLILSCLAKNPAARPSAAELEQRLATLAGDLWTEDHARRWWETNHPLEIHEEALVASGATWTAGGNS